MLLVYYNINHNAFYQVYKSFQFHIKVGDINGFGHMLVQILYIYNNRFYNVLSSKDCYYIGTDYRMRKKRFIKRLIRFLNKRLKG